MTYCHPLPFPKHRAREGPASSYLISSPPDFPTQEEGERELETKGGEGICSNFLKKKKKEREERSTTGEEIH